MSPQPIWQTYINDILNCLESRNYCEAIMDDLLLFTPSKQSYMIKLKDLLKAFLKNGLKICPKNVNYSEKNCNIWVTPSLFKSKECVSHHYALDESNTKVKILDTSFFLYYCMSSILGQVLCVSGYVIVIVICLMWLVVLSLCGHK